MYETDFGIGNTDTVEAMKRQEQESHLIPLPDPSDIPNDYPVLIEHTDDFDAGIDSFASNMVKAKKSAVFLPPIPTFDFEPTAKKNNISY